MKKFNVVFAGCAQNCSEHIDHSLKNIRDYSSIFNDAKIVILENGSKDNTRQLLQKNLNNNDYLLIKDELNNYKYRGQRLERARNFIIETIKKEINLRAYDLLIWIDLDDVGSYKIDNKKIIDAINFLYSQDKIGAVFANQLGIYYDMWTLRDDKYCKEDFWVQIFKYLMKNKNSYEDFTKFHFVKAQNYVDSLSCSFGYDHDLIKVNSAFGGFGIYKMKYVLNNNRKYEGSQVIEVESKDEKKAKFTFQKCEHVNFNFGIVEQGCDLFILPYLINRDFLEGKFPPQNALKLIM